jgi:hypothetical protein
MAAGSWAAAPGKGARWTTTNHVDTEPPIEGRHDAKQAGGGSQPRERHGLAAEVFMINRHRKDPVRRGFRLHISAPDFFVDGASIHALDQPLP